MPNHRRRWTMLINMKGILIFATGHPYYGRLAFNLAASIKSVEDWPISVVYSDASLSHLSERQLALFENKIELPTGIPKGCGSKLWANELTPYKETLVLDADMMWLPIHKPSELFNEMYDVEFTAITEGFYDYKEGSHDINPIYFFWCDPSEVKDKYKVTADKMYQWRSEVMYFKKSAGKIFKTAQKVFNRPNLDTIKLYATGVADELGINVAAAVHGVDPHKYKWNPSFWHMMNRGIIPDFSTLYENHYLASFGSNTASGNSKKLYDRLARAACYKLGLQHVFPLQSKRDYLPERRKM